MTISLVVNNKEKVLKNRYVFFIIAIIIIAIVAVVYRINKSKKIEALETASEIDSEAETEQIQGNQQASTTGQIQGKKDFAEDIGSKSQSQGQMEQQEPEKDNVIVVESNKGEQEQIRTKEIEEEKNAKGIIYLTFDDGPSLDTTPKILEILERRNIQATFFVLNYDDKKEDLIKKEFELGNTIALHGYSHEYSEIYQSPETGIENFKKLQAKVYQTTGKKSNIIRFPGGSSNTISRKYCEGVMTELTKRVVDEGFRYFDWNVDSDDAGSAKSSDDVYRNVTTGVKENRNNIVLMHDFGGNRKTIDALEGIINFGLDNGFVFRRITDDTPMCTHHVNN